MEKYYTLKIYDISLVDFSVQADEFGRLDVTVHEINDNKNICSLFSYFLMCLTGIYPVGSKVERYQRTEDM